MSEYEQDMGKLLERLCIDSSYRETLRLLNRLTDISGISIGSCLVAKHLLNELSFLCFSLDLTIQSGIE